MFIQINDDLAVNTNAISHIDRYDDGEYHLVMLSTEEEISHSGSSCATSIKLRITAAEKKHILSKLLLLQQLILKELTD